MKPPVILIPGIQGTKLANVNNKNFDTVWSGIQKFFDNIHDLLLGSDGVTDARKEIIIEKQDVEDLAYSEIINYLRSRGYPVYIFGYDWRKSNLENGGALFQFVKNVKKKHPNTPRFNFITHSMGCLVLSGMLRQMTEYQMKTSINRVIFTVPPFLGSLEAMFNLVIGKSKLFNSSDDFRKIARTFPSIFELCPVYNDAVKFKNGDTFSLYEYDNWQQNPNHPDFEKTKKQFDNRLKALAQVRSDNNLIFDLKKLPAEIKDNMLIVAGTGDDTQKEMEVDNTSVSEEGIKNKFNFSEQFEDHKGDGTVHLHSAEIFKSDITTISVESRWIEKRLDGRLIMADWHSFFLNNGRVQNIIKRFMETEKDQRSDNWYKSAGGGVELIS